jgi:hypothetical protein
MTRCRAAAGGLRAQGWSAGSLPLRRPPFAYLESGLRLEEKSLLRKCKTTEAEIKTTEAKIEND